MLKLVANRRAILGGPELGDQAERLRSLALTALALVGAMVLAGVVLAVLGANPLDAYWVIISTALTTRYGLTQTLLVTMPLILTGLAAAIPFSAQLWNIGGDGQLNAGAVASVAVALTFTQISAPALIVLSMLAGILAGALYGLIPGLLRALANVNEVIVTFMLNLLGGLLALYSVSVFGGLGVQESTRALPDAMALPSFGPSMTISVGLVISLVVALAAYGLLGRTSLGFAIRAIGANNQAARLAGFSLRKVTIAVFAIAGACAGLAGALLVLGVHHDVNTSLSSNYGLMGVAISLIARRRPLWIIPAAFLFAVVTVGGSNLTAVFGVPTESSLVIVAIFPILLMAFRAIRLRYPEV